MSMRKTLELRDQCAEEGALARRNGAPHYDNPYSAAREPDQFSAFREGWYAVPDVERLYDFDLGEEVEATNPPAAYRTLADRKNAAINQQKAA